MGKSQKGSEKERNKEARKWGFPGCCETRQDHINKTARRRSERHRKQKKRMRELKEQKNSTTVALTKT